MGDGRDNRISDGAVKTWRPRTEAGEWSGDRSPASDRAPGAQYLWG